MEASIFQKVYISISMIEKVQVTRMVEVSVWRYWIFVHARTVYGIKFLDTEI